MEAWRQQGYALPGSEQMLRDYEDKLQMEQGKQDLIYALKYPPAPPPPPPPSPEDTRNEIYARLYPPSNGPSPPPELEDLSDGTLGVAGDVHAIRKVLDASGVEHYLPFRHNSIVIGLPDVAKARNALAASQWASDDESDAEAITPMQAVASPPEVASPNSTTQLSMGGAQGLSLGGGTGLRFGGRRAGDAVGDVDVDVAPATPTPAPVPVPAQATVPASAPYDDGYTPQAKASVRSDLARETGGDAVEVGLKAPKSSAAWDAKDIHVSFQPTASSRGIRGVKTADCLVANVGTVEVYTPEVTETGKIARVIELKKRQSENILVQTKLPDAEINEIAVRVWGKPTAKKIRVLFFQREDGKIVRIDRPVEGN